MVDRDTFDALSEDPNESLRNTIIIFLRESPDKAYEADDITYGINATGLGSTDATEISDHSVMSELKAMIKEGIIQEKPATGKYAPLYALKRPDD